jgi:hypothetical protein
MEEWKREGGLVEPSSVAAGGAIIEPCWEKGRGRTSGTRGRDDLTLGGRKKVLDETGN